LPKGIEGGEYGGMDAWRASNLAAQAASQGAMLNWIVDDVQAPGTSLDQSVHEWKVVPALYASALWRKPVTVSDFDPPVDLFGRLGEVLT
jgi:hypothetical protein